MSQIFSDSYYQTSDLALAAMIALSLPLDSIDKTIPAKSLFIFKRENGLDALIEAYWRRELKVEPQAYFQSLKVLKTRLYQG